ncbi:MAG: DNA mismatch repair protein MutS [Parachlamydiaceae bacterium]|nr:DNA mismatch repair protein MutS [Parachlamydiaceae bacterium]
MTSLNLDEASETKITPMMQQWFACKKNAEKAILFFRMGDFYEAFYDDAIIMAKELELTLTKRHDIPMCGIPWHASDAYIDRLISKGHRVAVAEQTEDPKLSKGLVKREVVRVMTPGALMTSSLLSDRSNNFFASVSNVGNLFGLAYLDLTTAEFQVIELDNPQDLLNEIYRIQPAELLFSIKFGDKQSLLIKEIGHHGKIALTPHEDWHFEHQVSYDFLVSHFKVHSLDGFGMRGMVTSINAAGALLSHLRDNLCLNIDHVVEVSTYSTKNYMALDRTTQRNLELTEPLHNSNSKSTLLAVLDHTLTPMGARLIKQWIKQPLLCDEAIKQRQDAVESFTANSYVLEELRTHLNPIGDLERQMMRISSGCASPKDMIALKSALEPIASVKSVLRQVHKDEALLTLEEQKLDPLHQLQQLIEVAIVDLPPFRINDGGIFRPGYHQGLDELRNSSSDSKTWIANYQAQLRESSGIKTLKIGFTRVFGYYIEVSKGQSDKIPIHFVRQQTLVNAERFTTPELKTYENKVLNAEERSIGLEAELFATLRLEVAKYASLVLKNAQALGVIDCLHSFAKAAQLYHYSRPIVDHGSVLSIEEGRHPVIEALNVLEKFTPNDALLDADKNRLLVITGPNMAGKSTYIRQVALLVIMAQIGSFIPAKKAHIGVIDKVFTRIGASDDLARGQSTFMVEMTETATILNHATDRSLIILDEIGRGTSTYDGISIAWAVAEHLLITEGCMAKTLFATHYWELTKLEEQIPGAINYTVAVHESDEQIRFLRKIIRGNSDKSYGIHVGRLAGLPGSVIFRAKEILQHLEENANRKTAFAPAKPKRVPKVREKTTTEIQLTFFG